MTFRLNRNVLFLLGLTVIILVLGINRLIRYEGSKIVTGHVIGFVKSGTRTSIQLYDTYNTRRNSQTNLDFPLVQFTVDSMIYKIQDISNSNVNIGDAIEVMYETNSPGNAE